MVAGFKGQAKRISIHGRPCGVTQGHRGILSIAHEELVNSSVRIPKRRVYCFITCLSLGTVVYAWGENSYTSKMALSHLNCLYFFCLSPNSLSLKRFPNYWKVKWETEILKIKRITIYYEVRGVDERENYSYSSASAKSCYITLMKLSFSYEIWTYLSTKPSFVKLEISLEEIFVIQDHFSWKVNYWITRKINLSCSLTKFSSAWL